MGASPSSATKPFIDVARERKSEFPDCPYEDASFLHSPTFRPHPLFPLFFSCTTQRSNNVQSFSALEEDRRLELQLSTPAAFSDNGPIPDGIGSSLMPWTLNHTDALAPTEAVVRSPSTTASSKISFSTPDATATLDLLHTLSHNEAFRELPEPQASLLKDAVAYEQSGDIQKAIQGYLAYLAYNPNKPETEFPSPRRESALDSGCCFFYPFLGRPLSRTKQHHSTANNIHSCSTVWTALERRPQRRHPSCSIMDATVFDHLGQVFFENGALQEAHACYLEALELSPLAPRVLYHLGVLQYSMGNLQAARRHFIAAIREMTLSSTATPPRPTLRFPSTPILFSLGTLHRDLGQYNEAQQYFNNILRSQPNNNAALILLADCLEQKGNLLEASVLLQIALTMDPTDHSVRRSIVRLASRIDSPAIGSQSSSRLLQNILAIAF